MSDDPPTIGTILRTPTLEDGAALGMLVREVGTLEPNTGYAYLLLSHHFSDTCVVAERGDRLVGCVLAYRLPRNPQVLFVWQIGVAASERGKGLAKKMLHHLAKQTQADGVRMLEMTIAPSNEASNRLFDSFARELDVPIERVQGFEVRHFGPVGHEEELLVRIGPLQNASLQPEHRLRGAS